MDKTVEARLMRFIPNPKDADKATLTFEITGCKLDYNDFALFYRQPGEITMHTSQRQFVVTKTEDGEQLELEDALPDRPTEEDPEQADIVAAFDQMAEADDAEELGGDVTIEAPIETRDDENGPVRTVFAGTKGRRPRK